MNARTLSLITGLVTGLALAPSALAVSGCTNSYLSGNYANAVHRRLGAGRRE
jgi:hypothetical protein